jgi:hypothetical protein
VINPDDFIRTGTRRIRALAAAAHAPLVIGAGWDGHVYVWNVADRTLVTGFPTSPDSGGVSVALTPDARTCFVGTYYAWGVACVDVVTTETRWRRTDLRKVYGIDLSADATEAVCWFDGRAGLRLDVHTGATRARIVALQMFAASRVAAAELQYRRQLELVIQGQVRLKWARASFALLACAFSPALCVVAESKAAARAYDLTSGELAWVYESRAGAHVLAIEFCPSLNRFVAVEYAYSQTARDTGPMVALLHLDLSGAVVFHQPIREWSEAVVFAADGTLLLNGLGEVYETATASVVHEFDFPR